MIQKKDIHFEPIGSTGPGGQHVNRNKTGVRATHEPTGMTVVIRGRSLAASKRKAIHELNQRVANMAHEKVAANRKDRWRKAIKTRNIVRTYSFTENTVIDHRTDKRADLKKVLRKGQLDLLN